MVHQGIEQHLYDETHGQQERQEQRAPELTGTPSDAIVFDLRALATFQQDRPGVTQLSDIGAARVVLFAFQPGQQLREHQTSSQILVQVLRGKITFATADTSVEARAGTLIQLEANVRHSVTAHTKAVMLLTQVPSPSAQGQEQDVSQERPPLVMRIPAH